MDINTLGPLYIQLNNAGVYIYINTTYKKHNVSGDLTAVCPDKRGSKCAAHYTIQLFPGQSITINCCLHHVDETGHVEEGLIRLSGHHLNSIFVKERLLANHFYDQV